MTLEAETLMKFKQYQISQELFEKALSLAYDSYTYEDITYRWECALDELEILLQRPTFLSKMKERWEQIKRLLPHSEE